MARRPTTSRVSEKFVPLSLLDLDRVAGGLTDPDKNQTSGDPTTQTADGAAFAQTETPAASDAHDRFDALVQDFAPDHALDHQSPQQIEGVAHDVADGKLDGSLGTVVQMVGQLDAKAHPEQVAQLSAALLDRYADFAAADRPAALAGLLDQPGFQPASLASLAHEAAGHDPQAGLQLLTEAAGAFQAAGHSADATAMRGAFASELVGVLSHAEPETLTALLAEDTVTVKQYRDAFITLNRTADVDTMISAYEGLSDWFGSDAAVRADANALAVRTALVADLRTEAAGVANTAVALADAFTTRSADIQGLGLSADLATIYVAEARFATGRLPGFYAEVLGDTAEAGITGAAFATLGAWAYAGLVAASPTAGAWQAVDQLLDLPSSDEVDTLLTRAFADAMKTDPNAAVIGRLLSEGVASAPEIVAGLLQNYDVKTDTANGFARDLAAIAAAAGSAATAFNALIPDATFAAIVKEAADGTLDQRELTLVPGLVLADYTLPLGELPSAVLAQAMDNLAAALQGRSWTPAELHATTPILRDLVAAYGPALMAESIMRLARMSILNGSDVVQTLTEIGGDAGMTLFLIDFVKDRLGSGTLSMADARMAPVLTGALGRYTFGDALDRLADTVAIGRLDADAATKLVTELWPAATAAAVAPLLQAEVAVAKQELGLPDAASAVAALKASLASVPSPLIGAVAELGSYDLDQALHQLARVADALDADIGSTLARVQGERGVEIRDAAAEALATMIGHGELGAAEAVAAIRTVWARADGIDRAHDAYRDWYAPLAAEMGYVRLAEKAGSVSATDLHGAAELRAFVQQFHDQVAGGTFAAAALAQAASRPMIAGTVIELLNAAAGAADVFAGSLFVDVLANLGNGNGGAGDPTWQFRDALRGELTRMLTGDAATQAGWVAALKEALVDGHQSAASIVGELELMVENAFARQSLKDSNNHWNDTDAARQAMRDVWAGVDRIVAATGVALLADAKTSTAARDAALDWFRAQMPSGQLAILTALPAGHAETAALRAIVSQRLDTFDWAAEKQAADTHISVGAYGPAYMWTVFRSEHGVHDLRGAVALAGMVGESQAAPILDMARAWGISLGSRYDAPPGPTMGAIAYEVLTTGRTTLAQSLALEVKSGDATIYEVMDDLKTLSTFASRNVDTSLLGKVASPVNWANDTYTQVSALVTSALKTLGEPNAAAAAFVYSVDSGAAFANFAGGNAIAQLTASVAEANKLGVSVDYVLVAVLNGNYRPQVEAYALSQLQARLASGATTAGIAGEVADGGLSASRAIELLRDVAGHANASFGTLLANMLDSVQTANTRVYGLLGAAAAAMGSGVLAQAIGGDVAAGRVDAAAAASAVLEIAQASKADAARSLGAFVASAGTAAAGAAAVKLLDDVLAAGGTNLSVADTLDSIRTVLDGRHQSLATADTEALATLADLYAKGAIDHANVAGLIDILDGTVPDRGLIALMDKINALPNSTAQDALKLLVGEEIAERVESGALFAALIPELDATYRSGQTAAAKGVAYQEILDLVEKAIRAEAYAGLLVGIERPSAAEHAAAETLVSSLATLEDSRAAYELWSAAHEAPNSSGLGFLQWIANGSAENRAAVINGAIAEWTQQMAKTGEVSAHDKAMAFAVQRELIFPPLAAAYGPGITAAQHDAAAAQMAANLGELVGQVGSLVDTVMKSSAASVLLAAHRDRQEFSEQLAGASSPWVVIATSAAYSAATGGLPMTVAITAVQLLMQVEGFRQLCGSGLSATIEAGLAVLSMGRSVLVAGAQEFIEHKLDSAIGVATGTQAMFEALASGNAAGFGSAVLSFADNLSALANIYDLRSNVVAIYAAFQQAVVVFKQGYAELTNALAPLMGQDRDFERKHALGISFL
ncbi:MAG: hypothetical protein K2X72_17895 [Reyranella sp.]|nr:hypothetical protein [Reyranella sp.]